MFLHRGRLRLLFGMAFVMALGLASRAYPAMFPAVFGKYPGDVLWALLVFLGWRFVFPRAGRLCVAALALGSACAVEFSQLYQAPWINGVRGTVLGHLVLGRGFSWWDIAAYAVGVALGVAGAAAAGTLRR